MTRIFVALLLGVMVSSAAAQPPQVPRLKDRTLDRASYAELAKQWKAYMEANGESADGLVNLGLAYNYSEEPESAVIVARRAVKLAPDNPRALWFLAYMLGPYKGDDEAALQALEHCRRVAPEYAEGLTLLAAVHLRRGEVSDAEAAFKTLFDQRAISRPLQDYGYNMLVALPPNAVLITSGDNDTFPVLVLQSGMELRQDVIVLNRSLLNLPAYAESQFNRYPQVRPDYDIEGHEVKTVDGRPALLSDVLIQKLIVEKKAPVFLSVSTAGALPGYEPDHLEGINWAVSKKGLSPQMSARLFFDTYRLDSATDWTQAWALVPNEARLMSNYAAAMMNLADGKGISRETRTQLLQKALQIAEFHDLGGLAATIHSMQKQ